MIYDKNIIYVLNKKNRNSDFMEDVLISKNKDDIDIDRVVKYIVEDSYWGKGRDRDLIIRSINNSICYSIIMAGEFAGFGRVITDRATFKYICDLFILPEYQGKGLGKELLEFILEDPELRDGGYLLLTRDAHELYRKFGFEYARDNKVLIDRLMFKKHPRKE